MNLLKKIVSLFKKDTPVLQSNIETIQEDVLPQRNKKKWSDSEIMELVVRWQDDQSLEYIAFHMDRTVSSIQRKLSDLGYSLKKDAIRKSKFDLSANKTFE